MIEDSSSVRPSFRPYFSNPPFLTPSFGSLRSLLIACRRNQTTNPCTGDEASTQISQIALRSRFQRATDFIQDYLSIPIDLSQTFIGSNSPDLDYYNVTITKPSALFIADVFDVCVLPAYPKQSHVEKCQEKGER